MQERVLDLLLARRGHFLLESGHHGDLWLDLESLCWRPRLVRPLATELSRQLSAFRVDAICGPLVEGAFVALLVASELDLPFTYSERFARTTKDGLFPMGYRVPAALRDRLRDKRVAIVNDVINAGSAVKGTFADLEECGATVVAIAALLVLGDAVAAFASAKNIALVSLARQANNLWLADTCPLCALGQALEDVGHFAALQNASEPSHSASGSGAKEIRTIFRRQTGS